LDELLNRLGKFVACNLADEVDVLAINERQSVALEKARGSLEQVAQGICLPEVVATKLREAIFELEILIGRISPEEVLGEIFSRFCIGK
jgi:tRNA modification GTPase